MKTWIKDKSLTIIGVLAILLMIGPLVPFVRSAVDSEVLINGQQYNKSSSALVPKRVSVGDKGQVLIGGTGTGTTANTTTGGEPVSPPVCKTQAVVNISTATTTQVITGNALNFTLICSIILNTAAANNIAFISGLGATCGTGTAGISGGTTAASGWNWLAGEGIGAGTGVGMLMRANTIGDHICIVTSAATQLSGTITYTQYTDGHN